MFRKTLQGFVASLALLIALAYSFGYDYLFKGIRETYLRGETGSSISDGTYFPSHIIAKGESRPWENDSLYNKKPLPKDLVEVLSQSNTVSFLVIKNGKLLHEEYWNGHSKTTKTNSFSMAKAVNVMLLGKAIEDQKIKGLNEKYSDFYKNYEHVEFGKDLTLGDLAKMEAGLDWKENYRNPFLPNAKAYYGRSLAEAVFLRGFKEKPGTQFEYQSGASQLLGFAIRRAVNKSIAEYASEKLWKPLGMEQNADWTVDENGMEKTFCCIQSNSRDYAKLGQLFLDDGKVGNQQIMNPTFLEVMRTPTKLSNGVYGMGLWINNDATIKHYYFRGLYGQYIIIIPDKKMVVVRTGTYKDEPQDEKGRPKLVGLIVDEVVKNF
ncbi:serine hydrolase domain-containing protein [Chryseobacterium sp. R2A-55]|uniref:serine hydrolase domain-containing protein n=1 Tax=Chryseobacterium sp. R2A-55 TaxID=2744445 RepID=UPI001F304E0A|nr:serine hydrolase [Chryseobacterium sp. R2A-55]